MSKCGMQENMTEEGSDLLASSPRKMVPGSMNIPLWNALRLSFSIFLKILTMTFRTRSDKVGTFKQIDYSRVRALFIEQTVGDLL